MTNIAGLAVTAIFVASIFGLYVVTDFSQAESNVELAEKNKKPILDSSNEIIRTFNEIDSSLMSFFDEIREGIV